MFGILWVLLIYESELFTHVLQLCCLTQVDMQIRQYTNSCLKFGDPSILASITCICLLVFIDCTSLNSIKPVHRITNISIYANFEILPTSQTLMRNQVALYVVQISMKLLWWVALINSYYFIYLPWYTSLTGINL